MKGGVIIHSLLFFNKPSKPEQKPNFDSDYAKYYNQVFKHTAFLTGNIQAAEDITQETFIKLYNSPPSHSNTIAWLTTVATNLVYNYLRNEKVKKNKEPSVYENDANKVISIEDTAIRNHEIRLIRKVLSSMEPRDRLCLLLKFSGYKYSEIAEIIEVEASSVGTIISRSQSKFKQKFSKEVQD
ncbi:MAG: sigma-70 family RNA polymerase sigma factor [Deltaproteobacteria bacterium]